MCQGSSESPVPGVGGALVVVDGVLGGVVATGSDGLAGGVLDEGAGGAGWWVGFFDADGSAGGSGCAGGSGEELVAEGLGAPVGYGTSQISSQQPNFTCVCCWVLPSSALTVTGALCGGRPLRRTHRLTCWSGASAPRVVQDAPAAVGWHGKSLELHDR